jgi:hypothetical protein
MSQWEQESTPDTTTPDEGTTPEEGPAPGGGQEEGGGDSGDEPADAPA